MNEQKNNKQMTGRVISNKMKDTVVVMVERYVKHSLFGKFLRIRKKYKAHDEGNTCQVGDKVTIEEVRPISKEKRFKVVK